MEAEPDFRFIEARHRLLDQSPEPGSVIHLGEMGHLVGRDVVEHYAVEP